MKTVLWIIIALLLIGWLVGLFIRVASAAIHILLIVALVLFIMNMLGLRRT